MTDAARFSRAGVSAAGMLGLIILLAIAAPWIAPDHPANDLVAMRFLSPMSHDIHGMLHWLGTDRLGRDVWARLLAGARVSLAVGLLTMALSLVIGAGVGALAAFGAPPLRMVLLGITDFALGVPRVVLLLLLAALWQPAAVQVVVVLGFTGWMPIARLVHAELRSQMGRPYVTGARALGVGRWRLLMRHMAPHLAPLILAAVTLGIGNAITLEAGLSFLGLGVQPPTASWGTLIASGRDTVVNAPWVGIAPGIALVLVVMSCAILADAVQDRRRATGDASAL
jgi:peptide/nickel transport system permease protein